LKKKSGRIGNRTLGLLKRMHEILKKNAQLCSSMLRYALYAHNALAADILSSESPRLNVWINSKRESIEAVDQMMMILWLLFDEVSHVLQREKLFKNSDNDERRKILFKIFFNSGKIKIWLYITLFHYQFGPKLTPM
jgi:hypothetical protein